MARTTPCERQLMRAASDAAFRVLPPMVRLIWFELVAFAAGAPEKGRIRFLGSVTASVSRLLSLSETDVETGLETLAALGLVERDGETSSLWLPGARANTARAEAARINGLRGGRSRKGETPEQARARKQGNLPLVIPGGREETQETEAEPRRESSRAVLPTSLVKEASSTARETPVWVSLGQQVAEIAGLNGVAGGYDYRPVQGWLAKPGVTPEMVLATVRSVVARDSYPTGRLNTLTYFDGAMARAASLGGAKRDIAAGWSPAAMQDDVLQQARVLWALNPVGPMPGRAAA